ncbi:FkbM family methyltransferase [Synechococcus sp. HK05]|uniref:FkbM family methyltransferase n=1 Tax=Synechococcus sp. HK05 TaxID=2725975 RepID=UPI001C395313|nr:FkbM family methyltransferase [Synechococcus sp. HK05]MBV2350353.1 FkbM family methyltransferase [Synechococcus sp. HK05]
MFNQIRKRFHPLWRLRQWAWYRKVQDLVDPDVAIRMNGFKVYLKLLRDLSLILPHQGKERATQQAFSSCLGWGGCVDVFIDVGANIGSYSWLAKEHRVNDIFMFEPDPANCRLLMRTLRANRLEHVFLVPFAASTSAGVATFYPDLASGATGSLENHRLNAHSLHAAYGMGESIAVPTLPLDLFADFCYGKRVLIKIDVVGAEASVLAGAMDLIRQTLPVIIVECFEPSKLEVMRTLGYDIQSLEENGNYLLMPPSYMPAS